MTLKTRQWKKLGRIFCPQQAHGWMHSHASYPWIERRGIEYKGAENQDATYREQPIFRVYFSTRDVQNRSSIGYIDIDLKQPQQILSGSEQPVLTFGPPGAFDDSGASMGCLLSLENGDRYLYYLGWNLGVTVPWRNSIGLAIAKKGSEQFEKVSLAPVMDRHAVDPFSVSYPAVLLENKRFHMWYGSNRYGGDRSETMNHVIKYAESEDGIHWHREGTVALDFLTANEYALARPCIVKDDNLYKMWYSYRGAAYRIGYAESEDGVHWRRLDERAGIDVSPSGWDSQSIEYPCVFDYQDRRYMLYNGNDYGKTGFGLAILE